ncbi:PLP-dependent aminotransferase family protein [Clostridium sp. OS1-26]|uniref:aminotransferase-like domain-containing protein n=1 Tax=Clostridium sp. OS1-26 TaxID=3070681 RepID=UPI0027DFDFCE|nr:PLP-dependent aminotransferase family protein [Clostridium sp. OS1-26]WML33879.1 PLP-dependent aminotransferase family protein [Clostridium sp. OS1-26]
MAKYKLILDFINNQILDGKIKPGEKLPSIRELCKFFACSKATVIRAYDELEENHMIYAVPQSGYYLVPNNMNADSNYNNNIINFSEASPDSNALPYIEFQHCLNQAINIYKDSLFNYSNPQGLQPLLKVLSKEFQKYQVFTDEDKIFITSGSQQAINILSTLPFPNGKKNVLVEQPTYYGVLKSLEYNGVTAIGIRRTYKGLDFSDLERIFKNGNIKFFYTIPRFHNPTGGSYSSEEKKQILKLAERYDVYIVEDDYLGDLDINSKVDPIYSYDDNCRVIYLKSYSKVFLPGLRIAALVLPKMLTNIFSKYKSCADISTSVLSQGALEIYIKSGMFDMHIRKIKKLYTERMNCLKDVILSIDKNSGTWNIPSSGFFASVDIDNNISLENLVNNLRMRNVRIKNIKDNYLFNFNGDKLIRIGIATVNEEKIKKGIPILVEEIIKEKNNLWKASNDIFSL